MKEYINTAKRGEILVKKFCEQIDETKDNNEINPEILVNIVKNACIDAQSMSGTSVLIELQKQKSILDEKDTTWPIESIRIPKGARSLCGGDAISRFAVLNPLLNESRLWI